MMKIQRKDLFLESSLELCEDMGKIAGKGRKPSEARASLGLMAQGCPSTDLMWRAFLHWWQKSWTSTSSFWLASS